jgi:serine phosphatase RsbU (regulator of sigma subunit)
MARHRQSTILAKLGRGGLGVLQVVLPMTISGFYAKQARYWQTLSIRRMTGVLLGLFLTIGGIAFLIDLLSWQRLPAWALLIYAALWGAAGVAAFLSVLGRQFKFVPIYVVVAVALAFSGKWLPHGPDIPVATAARGRIAFDAVGLLATTLLGYGMFLRFITTQGVEQIRVRTQLELAQAMQQTLVPPVSYQTDTLEAYGISLPSEEVGGDLVDLISTERGLLAYVADVSGHGIPAGVLMGNLKTALRFGAAESMPLPTVLQAVNRVLPAVKQPEMYATFAGLCLQTKGEVEYCIAGHPPILQYQAQSRKVRSFRMEQFPLGLEGKCDYVSATANCEAGDVFALLSDGILETSDADGAEFGLERVRSVLAEYGTEPLKEIVDRLMNRLGGFGPRSDDQTVLLIRILRG